MKKIKINTHYISFHALMGVILCAFEISHIFFFLIIQLIILSYHTFLVHCKIKYVHEFRYASRV